MTDPTAASEPPDYVRIFDTTLRDGEQSPGATMTSDEKLAVARCLHRLGVDVIEAGFPAASPDDLRAVERIAELVGTGACDEPSPGGRPPIICALARTTNSDIDRAWQAVRAAERPRIHTFLATSDIHMKHKLRMSRGDVIARIGDMVGYARSVCDDVEFSPEDAGRTDPEFLCRALEVAIAAGATTLNITDTVGYTTPDEFGRLVARVIERTPGIDGVVVSVHCHNDLGLACANSLAGVLAGARQVEVAVNGIGERAGNTSLEEIVMALYTRRELFGLHTGVDTTQLVRASKTVSACTGMVVQPNKAVVGANAFAHESGIHQDGMLKHQGTYEIMRPETVGAGDTQLVLGKHSGRHAVKARLRDLGYELKDDALARAFERFKRLAEVKKTVTDADLEAVVSDEISSPEPLFELVALQVACGTMDMATATVQLLTPSGEVETLAAVGTGPVDAAFSAIRRIARVPITLLEFSVQSVTQGIDALGEVSVRIAGDDDPGSAINPQHERPRPRAFLGHGTDTDIVVASVKAYLAALNKLMAACGARAGRAAWAQ